MDFIDYDTFENNDTSLNNSKGSLPEPAPPLILPLDPNITNRFKNLSLSNKTFPFNTEDKPSSNEDNVNITSKTAEKYAKLSIELLDTNHNQSDDKLISDLPAPTTDHSKRLNDHFHTSTTKSSSVLSTRLSKILNSYDNNDPHLRDALLILQKKTNLEVESLIRPDLLGSISRRNFRSEIEGDLLKQHSNVLKEFQPVVNKIENIGIKINKLNEINTKLENFDKLDPNLISEIERLSKEKNLLILKKSLLTNFKAKFTLNQYEEHVLTNEEISIDFFKVLNKCKSIHSNCSILLTLGNQDMGLNIMEKMNKFLDLSYQRISFFLENQLLKNLNEENLSNNKDIKLLKISIFHLSDNLKYFDNIITKLTQLRSKTIVDEFLNQVSSTESEDISRPIVLSAHDPLRYIGDILAYVHSVIVNEVEFIKNLFQNQNNNISDDFKYERSEFEESLIQTENLGNVEQITNDTLVKIINSLSRPLKIRIEQIVRSEKHLEVLQKIFNLLDLFKMMYDKILPKDIKDCTIIESLDSLKSLCVERIFGLLKEKLDQVNRDVEQSGLDDLLLPPDWIRDYLSDILVIFQDSNVGSESNILELSDDLFEIFSKLIINKPIEILENQSKSLNDKRNIKIFKLNALDLIQSKIITIPQLSKKNDEVNELINTLKQELIEYQYDLLLKDSQLSIHQQLITLIFPIDQIETDDDYAMYQSLIENKLFGKPKLQEIEAQLHEFLPVALIDIQQSLFKISSPTIANDIITDSSLKFLNLYKVFYRILQEIYPDDQLLEWNTYDVATLLGVEEVYKNTL